MSLRLINSKISFTYLREIIFLCFTYCRLSHPVPQHISGILICKTTISPTCKKKKSQTIISTCKCSRSLFILCCRSKSPSFGCLKKSILHEKNPEKYFKLKGISVHLSAYLRRRSRYMLSQSGKRLWDDKSSRAHN